MSEKYTIDYKPQEKYVDKCLHRWTPLLFGVLGKIIPDLSLHPPLSFSSLIFSSHLNYPSLECPSQILLPQSEVIFTVLSL